MARKLIMHRGIAAAIIDQFTQSDHEYEAAKAYETVSDKIVANLEWESLNELVIKDKDGTLWVTTYRRGLTESQDSEPFDYPEDIEFDECVAVGVSVTQYRKVADDE